MKKDCPFWDRASYGLAAVGFVAAASTGVGVWLVEGSANQWLLFAHVPLGMAFAFGLLWFAIRMARRCSFGATSNGDVCGAVSCPGQKLLFWAILVMGFVSLSTMIAAMLPFFGYAGQKLLTEAHWCSGVGLLLASIAHWLLLLVPHNGR